MKLPELTRGERISGQLGNLLGSLAGGVVAGFWKQHPAAAALYDRWQADTGVAPAEPLVSNFKAYQVHWVVYACVKAIASQAAGVPLVLRQMTDPDPRKWKTILSHPILDLLRSPNPDAEESNFDLLEAFFSDWELAGEWYLYALRRSDGLPERMYRLRPDLMRPVPSKERRIARYVMAVNGEEIPFTTDEVTQSRTFNPFSDTRGMSTIRAGQLELTLDTQATLWNINFFKNNATPPHVLNLPGRVTPDKKKQLEESWNKGHRGTSHAHKLAIVSGGAQLQQVGLPHKDMDFILQREMSLQAIVGLFGLKPFMIGVLKHANYANVREQRSSFWHETMIPKLTKMQRALTRALCEPYDKSLVLEFDLTKVQALIEDALEMAKVDAELVRSGMYTINERRRERGLEPVPWGDTAWMQIQMVPVDGKSNTLLDEAGKALLQASESKILPAPSEVKGRPLYIDARMKAGRDLAWIALIAPSRKQFGKKVLAMLERQEKEVLEKLNAEKRLPAEIRQAVEERAKALAVEKGEELSPELISDAARVEAEVWLFDYEFWQGESIKVVHPTLLNAISEAGKFGLLELGLDMDFDLMDPYVQRELKAKEMVFAQEWNKSTLLNLRETLAEGITLGENIEQLTERANGAFNHEKNNAGVVAQTEVGAVSNAGAMESWRQSGVVEGKQWHASGPNPRPHHIEANGQIVPLDQEYQVGGEGLRYPGDPQGRADNVCNCHCSHLPVVMDVEE